MHQRFKCFGLFTAPKKSRSWALSESLSTAPTVGEWADRRLTEVKSPVAFPVCAAPAQQKIWPHAALAAWRAPAASGFGSTASPLCRLPPTGFGWEGKSPLTLKVPRVCLRGRAPPCCLEVCSFLLQPPLVIVNPALRRHNRKNKSASELLPFQEEALTISLKAKLCSHLHWRKCSKIELKYINSLFSLLILCPFLY